MGTNLTWRFVIIAIVVGFLGLQAYEGLTGKLQLGIDLEGGSEIIFKFDFSDKQPGTRAPLLNEAIAIVQDRIDGYGLKELMIQPIGDDRFSVAVPAKEKKNVDAIKNPEPGRVMSDAELQELGDFEVVVDPQTD